MHGKAAGTLLITATGRTEGAFVLYDCLYWLSREMTPGPQLRDSDARTTRMFSCMLDIQNGPPNTRGNFGCSSFSRVAPVKEAPTSSEFLNVC